VLQGKRNTINNTRVFDVESEYRNDDDRDEMSSSKTGTVNKGSKKGTVKGKGNPSNSALAASPVESTRKRTYQ
jgi:hypothetical protein